ncbi:WcaG Nucleoside-diphosphate-sugar epimerases [Candidatus Nanopelagicaceae bacterium]
MLIEKRLLVTGSTGFIGKKFLARIKGFDFKVIKTPKDLDLQNAELTSDFVQAADPHLILHLATNAKQLRESPRTTVKLSPDDIDVNIVSASLKLRNLKRFVSLGTCDEYGKHPNPYLETDLAMPVSGYGSSKLAMSNYLLEFAKNYDFPSVILRPSVVYGTDQPSTMFVPSLFSAMKEKRVFALTCGDQTRDFIFVEDLIDAIIKSFTEDNIANGSIFNIASQSSLPIKDVANKIADLFGPGYRSLLDFGALDFRDSEVMDYRVNAEKAASEINWRAKVSLDQGLRILKDSIVQTGF